MIDNVSLDCFELILQVFLFSKNLQTSWVEKSYNF